MQRAGGPAAQVGTQRPLSGAVRQVKSAWLSASSPLLCLFPVAFVC